MRSFPNIESKKFPGKGYYVGYGVLCSVWHIVGESGNWYVTPAHFCNDLGVPFSARTLQEISDKLRTV